MIRVIEFDRDGAIVANHLSPPTSATSDFNNRSMFVGVLDSIDPDMVYVNDGKLAGRPQQNVGVDYVGKVISEILEGTHVFIDGEFVGACFTGCVEIEKESDLDTVVVRLSLFPYIDKEITI